MKMGQMFSGATEFKQDLCGWKRKYRPSCDDMFTDTKCESVAYQAPQTRICEYPVNGPLLSVCRRCQQQPKAAGEWDSFQNKPELQGEVDKYCESPGDYDASKYGPIGNWDV